MNIYATKDILIGYFQQPFAAPSDGEVLSAISNAVNNQENMSAIAQAPHHFQVWKLGEVDQDGNITPTKELIAECNSLIRERIRKKPNGEGEVLAEPLGGSQSPPERTSG